jgi:hypothetical protein
MIDKLLEDLIKTRAIFLALKDELTINFIKYDSWWSWVTRKADGKTESKCVEITYKEKQINIWLDAKLPSYTCTIWTTNALLIAMTCAFDKPIYQQLSKFYSALEFMSTKYGDLSFMIEKNCWSGEMAEVIGKEMAATNDTLSFFKENYERLLK